MVFSSFQAALGNDFLPSGQGGVHNMGSQSFFQALLSGGRLMSSRALLERVGVVSGALERVGVVSGALERVGVVSGALEQVRVVWGAAGASCWGRLGHIWSELGWSFSRSELGWSFISGAAGASWVSGAAAAS